jgi:alpha-acetolactate decarboxylase
MGTIQGFWASSQASAICAEVFHLALLDEFFDGSCHIFNGHVRIDAVLIEKIDCLDLQSLERRVTLFDTAEAYGPFTK